MNRLSASDEVNWIALIKPIWIKRIFILKLTLLASILGLFVAILMTKEFVATSVFVPQSGENSNAGSNFSGLASLAGISLGNSSSSGQIPLSLYPKIVASYGFLSTLSQTELNLKDASSKMTYREYYENYAKPSVLGRIQQYTIGLPSLVIGMFANSNDEESLSMVDKELGTQDSLIFLSQTDKNHFRRIQKQLLVDPDEKQGFVRLTFKMGDPFLAAQMAKAAEKLLQSEIMSFKSQKAREQLEFIKARYDEKRLEFEAVQTKLAQFQDANRNITSALSKNELDRIQSEYDLKLGLYTELAKQLEQAKIEVSKNTPIFTVIQPVVVPVDKVSPNRPSILISFIFIGLLSGVGWIYLRLFFVQFYSKLKN